MHSHKNIFFIFSNHPEKNGVKKRILGKFLLNDGEFKLLEDHGLQYNFKTATPEKISKHLLYLSRGQRTSVANLEDIRQGFHPTLLNEVKGSSPDDLKSGLLGQYESSVPELRVSHFHYHRPNYKPSELQIKGNIGYLDGQELSPKELNLLMDHVRSGKAKVTNHPTKLNKSEEVGLDKKHLEQDTVFPAFKNLGHLDDFLKTPHKGVFMMVEPHGLDDFGEEHGTDSYHHALGSFSRILRNTFDDVTQDSPNKWRQGGTKFVLLMDNPEMAANVARTLRDKLKEVAPLHGSYQLKAAIAYGSKLEDLEPAIKILHQQLPQSNESLVLGGNPKDSEHPIKEE